MLVQNHTPPFFCLVSSSLSCISNLLLIFILASALQADDVLSPTPTRKYPLPETTFFCQPPQGHHNPSSECAIRLLSGIQSADVSTTAIPSTPVRDMDSEDTQPQRRLSWWVMPAPIIHQGGIRMTNINLRVAAPGVTQAIQAEGTNLPGDIDEQTRDDGVNSTFHSNEGSCREDYGHSLLYNVARRR